MPRLVYGIGDPPGNAVWKGIDDGEIIRCPDCFKRYARNLKLVRYVQDPDQTYFKCSCGREFGVVGYVTFGKERNNAD